MLANYDIQASLGLGYKLCFKVFEMELLSFVGIATITYPSDQFIVEIILKIKLKMLPH